jgi:hypothetical protein
MRHLVKWSEKKSAFGQNYQVSAIGGNSAHGSDWRVSEDNAITEIESGKKAYFIVLNGSVCDLVVGRAGGITYLKSRTDTDLPHALLDLPDFQSVTRSRERAARSA